ncbi:hypothetical protein [Stratiformator vulcanicus]|uniref:DUF559 domain-containing protein n=1 Tax=Stratiformator vulcanicus TaxID=2527980 RepID=A0A517R786_9PLAN|nr:hypothetical protein [Stratiformator vulcanicus]QDT39750.1 hypothetical protein Pan189_41590 [Stratiformator vulcanicus]
MSELEAQFEALLNRAEVLGVEGIPDYVREFAFDTDRKWRFDFAWPWPRMKVAVELEGGILSDGPSGHRSKGGVLRDIEKYNRAAELGWRVLRYSIVDVRDRPLQTLEQIERVIGERTPRRGLAGADV